MAKQTGSVVKTKTSKFFLAIIIALLILCAGYFLLSYFVFNDTSRYLIQNKYYGFELRAPKSWMAEGSTIYSEDNIAQFLSECKNSGANGSSAYEVGKFRFQDHQYPQDFGNAGYFPAGLPSGAILDVTVSCIPENLKSEISGYSNSNLKISGEKTLALDLTLPQFGAAKYLSFMHDNLLYKLSEYVYISPSDANSSSGIRKNYAGVFSGIISSFKIIK